ncbi:MAG: glycosyl hydrolase, partial [Cyclobacteriaceae bacterium]|nr:glycosyl hydrolase [Cyclobacteriaceae bacterium]
MKKTALIGTAKGLIVYDFVPDEKPVLRNVHFVGFSVNMVYVDERTDKWWIGVSHKHWGQKLHFSTNAGLEWYEAAIPSFKGVLFPNGEPTKLRQIWSMAHGGHPNELWLGTDPGGLFHSDDNGKSFEIVKSLWEHPSRSKPGQWFGAGSDHPFIHSILVDPTEPDHVYIGVSCAGIFETIDGGKNWNPKNKGLKAAYLPNPNVEIGHDPHQLHMHPKNNKILWQQNH